MRCVTTPTSSTAWKDPLNLPLPRLALTVGEPAGIGPDICLQLADRSLEAEVTVLADPGLMRERARLLKLNTRIVEQQANSSPGPHVAGTLQVQALGPAAPVTAGQLDVANAGFVLQQIETAALGCLSGQFDAMVTAPAHKAIINQSGHTFSGHTEYLAQLCDNAQPVMMLSNKRLRVVLVTHGVNS